MQGKMKLCAVIIATLQYNFISLCNGEGTNSTDCTLLKDNLAASISSFTNCAISYSRPILFCEQCINEYINVVKDYQNISTTVDEDGPCINGYVHIDKLEIVQTLYDNSISLWERAKCYECFTIINGTLTNITSNHTTTFNQLFIKLSSCINGSDVNATNVCTKCSADYEKLDSYYRSITNEKEKIGVCMDIVDVMNGTRGYWSSNCCKFRHKDETVFVVSTVIVTSITLLFYLLTKFCAEKKIPVLSKQTRFAGSFSQIID